MPLTFTHAKGNVMLPDELKFWKQKPCQRSDLHERRSFFTHVGIVCADSRIQPLLPQVMFIAANLLTNAQFAALQAELPANVYVKRMKSGWTTKAEHCVILRLLRLVLEPFLGEHQPILLFDACGVHISDEALEELRMQDLWYIVIPARLTWLLQPLDTHCFLKYKRYLKSHFQDALGAMAADPLVCLLYTSPSPRD